MPVVPHVPQANMGHCYQRYTIQLSVESQSSRLVTNPDESCGVVDDSPP
jgi:hypothetical protein